MHSSLLFGAAVSLALVVPSAVPAPLRTGTAVVLSDSIVTAARRAMAEGRPWQASRLLTPLLADSMQRTPERLLLAAEASSQWGGATETIRLLERAPWLDRERQGAGHALLAAAYLAARRDSFALESATSAVRTASTPRVRAEREVLLARALDRLDRRADAARAYRAAAEGLPTIGDWLRLRAIGVTDDSAARTALGTSVASPIARTRLPWMEAQALERQGDSAAAARSYVRVGATLKVLSLRLGALAAQDSVRAALVRLLERPVTGEDGRTTVALLRRAGGITAKEQLLMARVLDRSGDGAGAAAAYALALKGRVLKAEDRLAYADVLVRSGRNADAVKLLKPLSVDRKFGATASYRLARAEVRGGNETAAHRVLVQIPVRWSRDTVPAAQALYLLGDLATDALDDADAVGQWRQLTTRYPTSPLAPAARFRTGIALFVLGDAAGAAGTLDSLVQRYPTSGEVMAASYWAGRAHHQLGDSATAAARWRTVIAADRRSWYAALSEARLGIEPWRPAAAADAFASVPEVDSMLTVARLLDRLGMEPEARREVAAVVRAAAGAATVERLLAVAHALRTAGYGAEAITVARRVAPKQPEPDARTWRLLYPLAYVDALKAEAALRGIDPTFAAALIRQESMYDASALSRAGARGLMQLMPEVGRLTARGLRYPQWDVALLWQPDVNLELGMLHLSGLMGRYREPVRVLAAYNAGASRVERWATKGGVSDPELFAERIPYAETRDYVRVIQRNQQFYRVLYDWPSRAMQP